MIDLDKYKILTLPEVAEVLKVSEKTVGILFKAGDLNGKKVGREWRTTTEHIKEYLNS